MSLDVELTGVAVAAVNLQAVVAHLGGRFAREELRHGRFERKAFTAVAEPSGPVYQKLGGIHRSAGVGQHPLNGLKVLDEMTECGTLFCILHRHVQGSSAE